MHAQELWTGKTAPARAARIALLPASWLYGFGWQCYLATYRLGIKKAQSPHRPILCIGNLQTGGSGKTPLVLHLVEVLRQLGHEVVVSCSGYGSPRSEAATVAPDGELDAREWGDEPTLMRRQIPDLPIVVGRRRVLAAQLVHERFPKAVMLMDDGFQHLPLAKQLTIVLDPATPANRHCLPAGPYREPRKNRARADLVLPGDFQIVSEPTRFVTPDGELKTPVKYSILCGLGRPELFVKAVATSLPHAGPPEKVILRPDHDPLDAGTLLQELPEAVPVIVTAKDWVKLRERPDWTTREFLIASHAVRVEPYDEFRNWLEAKLNV